eukprot:450755-Pelagomonas_calceolata.AAC.2
MLLVSESSYFFTRIFSFSPTRLIIDSISAMVAHRRRVSFRHPLPVAKKRKSFSSQIQRLYQCHGCSWRVSCERPYPPHSILSPFPASTQSASSVTSAMDAHREHPSSAALLI